MTSQEVEVQLDKIRDIERQVETLRHQVTSFTGEIGSKNYVYIEEALMAQLLSLDSTETFGLAQIRTARKVVVTAIQHLLAGLEARAS